MLNGTTGGSSGRGEGGQRQVERREDAQGLVAGIEPGCHNKMAGRGSANDKVLSGTQYMYTGGLLLRAQANLGIQVDNSVGDRRNTVYVGGTGILPEG